MIHIIGDPSRAIRALRKTERAIERLGKELRHRRSCPKPLRIDGHAYHRRVRSRRRSR